MIDFKDYSLWLEGCASCAIEGDPYGEKITNLLNSDDPDKEYIKFDKQHKKRMEGSGE